MPGSAKLLFRRFIGLGSKASDGKKHFGHQTSELLEIFTQAGADALSQCKVHFSFQVIEEIGIRLAVFGPLAFKCVQNKLGINNLLPHFFSTNQRRAVADGCIDRRQEHLLLPRKIRQLSKVHQEPGFDTWVGPAHVHERIFLGFLDGIVESRVAVAVKHDPYATVGVLPAGIGPQVFLDAFTQKTEGIVRGRRQNRQAMAHIARGRPGGQIDFLGLPFADDKELLLHRKQTRKNLKFVYAVYLQIKQNGSINKAEKS